MTVTETAYAKINLALHVRGRRADGYHDLETLFAFVDCGDVLTARSAAQDSVETVGEFASALGNPLDNLVARALNILPRDSGLAITLEKNLPVAAGLGGGSADAGAVFRIVRALHGLPEDWRSRAAQLGADVPACVDSETCIGQGTGTELIRVENDLSGMAVLLANPRIPLSTAEVFGCWDNQDRGPLPDGPASRIARKGRNDLEAAAVALCQPIGRLLGDMGDSKPWLARMSGSGATCFALYGSDAERDRAARALADIHPDYWFMKGHLR